MSDLFGGGGDGGPASLTESIFGTAPAAAASSSAGDLFAEPTPSSPSPKRQRTDGTNEASASSSGSESSESSSEDEEEISAGEIVDRRREQSQRKALEQLTLSVDDYRGSNYDELCADVRGIVKHHGLAIVRGALSDGEVDVISCMADTTRRRVCEALEARDIPYDDPVNDEEAICFRELAVRCKGRMDVRYCDETARDKSSNNEEDEQLQLPQLELIDQLARSVIHGAEPPNQVYAGWIFSLPGSADQPWHQDGCPLFAEGTESLPIYALNVFCGLHDAQLLELGPTEFVVGSHRMAPESAMEKVRDAVSAVLNKGDVLLYDYRICHRGTSNLSGEVALTAKADEMAQDIDGDASGADDAGAVRKVLYLMYARPWFREHLNFGGKSLFE